MLQKLLGDTSFHRLLQRIDEDVAEGVRSKGCRHCGAALHSARYERKPRGGPSELPPKYERRASFCCAAAGCRKRETPPALRFWGPAGVSGAGVSAGVQPAPRDHAETNRRVAQAVAGADVESAYAEALAPVVAGGVPEEFVLEHRASAVMPPVDEKSLPAALLARFGQTDAAEQVVAALRYLRRRPPGRAR